MIKSFKASIPDGGQDTIRLSTNNGLTGYKINKLQVMPYQPGHTHNVEFVLQVFTVKRTTVPTATATVEFDDPTLLGVVYYQDGTSHAYPSSTDVVFDHVVFNQDVFITLTDNEGTGICNYYLELEQVKLDVNEATVATLKDMRGTA